MSKIDTSTEAVTKLMDGVTPGPWDYIIGRSDWGLPRSNVVVPLGVSEFDFDAMIAEVNSVTPYCAGSSQKEREKSATADANARFIAAARDLVPALLAERDALKAERDEAIEGWHVIHPNITVQDAAKVLLTAREQGQIDVEAVKLFLKGQPVAALRAIAEGRE